MADTRSIWEAAYDYTCPRCGEGPNLPCRGPKGRTLNDPGSHTGNGLHRERIILVPAGNGERKNMDYLKKYLFGEDSGA